MKKLFQDINQNKFLKRVMISHKEQRLEIMLTKQLVCFHLLKEDLLDKILKNKKYKF